MPTIKPDIKPSENAIIIPPVETPPTNNEIKKIRERSLACWTPWQREGRKQKHIRGIQTAVGALQNLCNNYTEQTQAEQVATQRKAYSQLSFFLAYQDPDLFADQAGVLKIPFPKEDGSVGYYLLDKTIDFGGGMKAFGFKGQKGDPPLLLFHGTHMKTSSSGMGRTVIADLDPFGPGRTHFDSNEHSLTRWLQKATEESGKKAIVTGHSLGGCFATYSGVYHTNYVEKAVAFNAPTVDSRTYRAWSNTPETGRAKIETFRTKGDKLSDYGHGYLVGDHFTVTPDNPKYKGSHKAAIFVRCDNPTVTSFETNTRNKKAGTYLASAGRFFCGIGKSFVAVPVIVGLWLKTLAFGRRSWSNCNYGVPATFIPYETFRCSTENNSKLSNKSLGKIDAFFKPGITVDDAWNEFKNEKLTLQEFSAIYFLLELKKDRDPNQPIRTTPIKVELMREVIQRTLSSRQPEFQKLAQMFYETLKTEKPEQLLYYLYHEADFVTDLQAYLETKHVPTEMFRTAMAECRKHVKTIRAFEAFKGEDMWSEKSDFQIFITTPQIQRDGVAKSPDSQKKG